MRLFCSGVICLILLAYLFLGLFYNFKNTNKVEDVSDIYCIELTGSIT